jgi:hypothetical protein
MIFPEYLLGFGRAFIAPEWARLIKIIARWSVNILSDLIVCYLLLRTVT